MANGIEAYKPVLTDVRDGREVSLLHLPKNGAVTIFLVHGACATWRQFLDLIPALAEKYAVVTWDAFGCGASPKPRDWEVYSTEELLLDLQAIYRKYSGSRNVVIGHSFGSSQAMRLAAWHEHERSNHTNGGSTAGGGGLLLGLVLLSSAYHMPDGGHPVFWLPSPVFTMVHPIVSKVFKTRALDPSADRSIFIRNSQTNAANPTHMVQAFYRQMLWVPRETIKSITTRSIIVHGQTDGIIPLEQAERLSNRLQNTTFVVLPQTGHMIMQERPQAVLQNIFSFIESLEPKA